MTYDRRTLNQFIVEHFDDNELRILSAVEFRGAYEDFSEGWGKKRKVLELIGWCERNGAEARLLAALKRERPRPFRTVFGAEKFVEDAQPVSVPLVERNPRQIFISHAHEDAELAQRLAHDLRRHGWQTWIAPDSIRPGEQWVEAINRGLEESGIFLILLTPQAVRSSWVTRETNAAVSLEHEGELLFYPLRVKPCRPPALWRSYQFIGFQGDYQADLGDLLAVLRSEPAKPQPAPSLSKEAASTSRAKAVQKPKPQPAKIEAAPHRPALDFIPKPPEIWEHPITSQEMIRIPAGDFLFGEKKEEVHLPEFWIDKTPVTNADYARFVAAEEVAPPSHWQGSKSPPADWATHPVVNVSWHDAQAYADWAGCRLPTEQEWEKAARGLDGRLFPWGDEWEGNRCNTAEAGIGTTSPVGQFSPQGDSPFGCVDMSGNVWEWTNSWWDSEKTGRVVRGGSWISLHWLARVGFRSGLDPLNRYDYRGFRVVSPVGPGS